MTYLDLYKSIWISPPSLLDPENLEKTLENLKTSKDYDGSSLWLEVGTWSVDEMTLILVFLRKFKDILKVQSIFEYELTYFDFSYSPEDNSFNSIGELSRKGNHMPDNCWFALRIREDSFIKFWDSFIEFCLKNKFVFWYGPELGKIDWFTINMT